MSVKNAIDETLQKPMDRRDFLSHVGAALLAVIGMTSVLHSLGLHTSGSKQVSSNTTAGRGYGSSAYGV